MSYPKPLSEKSLARLYAQSGLTQPQTDYLHGLFRACANLYGAIELRDMWLIHQGQKNAPSIRRKDLLAFSAIARREEAPYYVFEIDELYSEEKRTDLSRMVVHRDLIGTGYGRLARFYILMEEAGQYGYYQPEDILAYVDPKPSEEETALRAFLDELKVTAATCVPPYGDPYPCEHRGQKLGEFSFLTRDERSEAEIMARNKAEYAAFLRWNEGTEAEKLFRHFRNVELIHSREFNMNIKNFLSELTEVGAELSMEEMNELLQLLMNYHNNTRVWCMCGWSPTEMMRMSPPSMPESISIGPNMKKMFESGELNRDEFMEKIRKLGIKVIE